MQIYGQARKMAKYKAGSITEPYSGHLEKVQHLRQNPIIRTDRNIQEERRVIIDEESTIVGS